MKKTRLYALTLLGITLVVLLVGWGALHYYYVNSKQALLEQKMESGNREIRELGILLEQQLKEGISPAKTIENLQRSILNTDVQSEFVCMYNTEGIELCHPNPSFVGSTIDDNNSSFSSSGNQQTFTEILKAGQQVSGIRTFPLGENRGSEIVSVYPVKGTNWMLASHINIGALQDQLDQLYQKFLLGGFLMILMISGGCYLLIRLLYRKYEQEMDQQIITLNEDINTLGLLNRQLELKQQNTEEKLATKFNKTSEEPQRKRLITYHKDELVTIDTQDIVYIALHENVVSVFTSQNKTYTINSNLSDLMQELDSHNFYRANRQYIININAVESIKMYGRNQLRLSTNPKCPEPIVISKNNVAEFKKWLDK